MRLLLVEDNRSLAEGIQVALRRQGYAVDIAHNAHTALQLSDLTTPDIMLLDLGLPDRDGIDVLRQLRRNKVNFPILILTARDNLEEKIRGLDAGADDYLTKPFELQELFARLRALERRGQQNTMTDLQVDEFRLDLASHCLTIEATHQSVSLSRREFALLRTMMERPGQLFSRAQLEQKLYAWDEEVASNTVDVHIHNLRKKTRQDFIRNIRGVGYMVVANNA